MAEHNSFGSGHYQPYIIKEKPESVPQNLGKRIVENLLNASYKQALTKKYGNQNN